MIKVKFFPKAEFPSEVCFHRRGADLTISETTDTIQPQVRYAVEYYGFKHNIRAGAYIGYHYQYDGMDISWSDKAGNIRMDVYLNVSAVANNYENAMAKIKPWFISLTGRNPSAVSFAGGNQSLANYTKDDFLAGRNSQTGDFYYNNYNKDVWANRKCGIRWFDQDLSWEDVGNVIENVAESGGWLHNFTHWHNLSSAGVVYKQEEFYETINNTLERINKKAHLCSAGEAVEYACFRDSIKRVSCYKSINGNLRVALEISELPLPLELNTPVSIKINLTGTDFADVDLKSDLCDILKIGEGVFILEVPYFNNSFGDNKILVADLEVTDNPSYVNTSKPYISYTTSDGDVEVTVDRFALISVFIKVVGASDSTFIILKRQDIFSKNIIIDSVDFDKYEYAVGVVDKYGNQNVLDL